MPQSSQTDRRNGESRAVLPLPTGESGSPPCCGKGVCIRAGKKPAPQKALPCLQGGSSQQGQLVVTNGTVPTQHPPRLPGHPTAPQRLSLPGL